MANPSETEWFPRFGAISGVSYTPLAEVDVKRLRGVGIRPEVNRSGGGALWWPAEDGSSTASPAYEHDDVDLSKTTPVKVLRHLAEVLELPGIASDYHFAIQGAAEALWKRRRADPSIFSHVERLSWLDLDLIRARPGAVSYDRDGGTDYYSVAAFGYLTTLYRREGALREALEVAELAGRFGQANTPRDDLAQRIAALEAETSG
jgi:hypothetical protein